MAGMPSRERTRFERWARRLDPLQRPRRTIGGLAGLRCAPRQAATLLSLALLAAIVAATLASCKPEPTETPEPALPRSMKGYELYSWYESTGWQFALVAGTNRLKTFAEVSSPRVRLASLEALKSELERLPSGEQVLWSLDLVPGTTLPPSDIVEEVHAFCRQRGIQLLIDGVGATDR